MLMNATIDPSPSVGHRVSRIRHICASIEAPCSASFRTNLSAIAKQRPDGIWTALVSGGVLLIYLAIRRSWMVSSVRGLPYTPSQSKKTLSLGPHRLQMRDRTDKRDEQSPRHSRSHSAGRWLAASSSGRGSLVYSKRRHYLLGQQTRQWAQTQAQKPLEENASWWVASKSGKTEHCSNLYCYILLQLWVIWRNCRPAPWSVYMTGNCPDQLRANVDGERSLVTLASRRLIWNQSSSVSFEWCMLPSILSSSNLISKLLAATIEWKVVVRDITDFLIRLDVFKRLRRWVEPEDGLR